MTYPTFNRAVGGDGFEAAKVTAVAAFAQRIDRGTGAGIIANGHIFLGSNGNVGEIGHIQVDPLGSQRQHAGIALIQQMTYPTFNRAVGGDGFEAAKVTAPGPVSSPTGIFFSAATVTSVRLATFRSIRWATARWDSPDSADDVPDFQSRRWRRWFRGSQSYRSGVPDAANL
jgi:hypothetical protein